MSDSFRRVSNPLTIVAIFAGLSEIAGTVAIKFIIPDLQIVFIWFVMGFPVLLLMLFFATLNFNPTVLYAPSDFRDDDAYLKNQQKLFLQLNTIGRSLTEAEIKIATQNPATAAAHDKETELQSAIGQIKKAVESATETASELTLASNGFSGAQLAILDALAGGEESTLKSLSEKTGLPIGSVRITLRSLTLKGFINARREGTESFFSRSNRPIR